MVTYLKKIISLIYNKEFIRLGKAIRMKIYTRKNKNILHVDHVLDKFSINKIVIETIENIRVDIIVPIFNGYDFIVKLFDDIFNKTSLEFRLIIINDASTDKKVINFLDNIALNKANVVLLTNQNNIGFVKSVNRALRIIENHCVILNTDVELPHKWLERLILPIIKNPNIASTTPFTNSGTICSFPEIGIDNSIFENLTVDELDSYFQYVNPEKNYIEIPSGVGFCMAMNKKVIEKIGIFDEENFFRGYGEENDWCMRAIKAGYTNVMVTNLFVYHKHGGTFMSMEKDDLIKQNSKKLLIKHPDFNEMVNDFVLKDPAKLYRDFIILIIISSINKITKKIIMMSNYVDKIRSSLNVFNRNVVFLIKKNEDTNSEFLFNFRYKKISIQYQCNQKELTQLLRFLNIDKNIK